MDGRADLYSLGASLFLALTGVEPFKDGNGPLAVELYRRATAPPPRARQHRRDLPAEMDDLVAKLMDPDPARRFPTANAVSAA
ncbi:MAG: hypothetical protein K2V38_29000, partial [Gemmataceae bacterium]|nr:hypothetical protein [Gemmataceae bacterium]